MPLSIGMWKTDFTRFSLREKQLHLDLAPLNHDESHSEEKVRENFNEITTVPQGFTQLQNRINVLKGWIEEGFSCVTVGDTKRCCLFSTSFLYFSKKGRLTTWFVMYSVVCHGLC